jgi:hypothetical protein
MSAKIIQMISGYVSMPHNHYELLYAFDKDQVKTSYLKEELLKK